MPRFGLGSTMIAALESAKVNPFVLAEIGFASGIVRAFTGIGILNWGGFDWGGVIPANETDGSSVIQIGEMTESARLEATGMSIVLSGGVAGRLMELALLEGRHGKPARIYQGFMDDNGEPLPSPTEAWAGQVDIITINENPDNPTISIQLETRLISMKKRIPRRYTHEDHQFDHPGDNGFIYVIRTQRSTPSYIPPD